MNLALGRDILHLATLGLKDQIHVNPGLEIQLFESLFKLGSRRF